MCVSVNVYTRGFRCVYTQTHWLELYMYINVCGGGCAFVYVPYVCLSVNMCAGETHPSETGLWAVRVGWRHGRSPGVIAANMLTIS